ncbi:hypothetical protein NQZ68_041949 [Dissostichus eleginoides]|nr:hypothetical protein NQZ68_041949 [Dissostichus eleginoides]
MPSSEHVKRILVVHRGQVLRELIAHFCDEELQEVDFKIKLIMPDGKAEMAYDEGEVVRDCLSEFWKEFYEQCTMGNTFRVPFLRHDFEEKQWESVGRIIAFGWARAKYLPVKIAPVILEQASLGCIKSDLVENFLQICYYSNYSRLMPQKVVSSRMRYIRSTNHSAPFLAAQPITEHHSTQCKQ